MLVATAGHIDHGKTALVRALTGVETDRLPEERARGISIDLGFAYWTTDAGNTIGFVDVPGHERFVRNMLAGVTSVDFALLVVAADDGVMPQSIEHVEIVDLLGITRGAVAITKCDKVSDDRVTVVRDQVSGLLARTTLSGAPIFEVSSITGAGIPTLAKALQAASQESGPVRAEGRNFRLAVDRAFSITGAGTVVTGTAIDGALDAGDRLVLSPRGKEVRARGLQSAGKPVSRIQTGERCAINLAGVELAEVHRGDWLVVPGMHASTARIDARIRILARCSEPLQHNTWVHLHLGTDDITTRVLIPGQAPIPPGSDAVVHLVLEHATCAVTGDRLVLRDHSGRQTIGGGLVIDPYAPASRRNDAARAPIWAAMQQQSAEQALGSLLAIPGHEVDVESFERSFNLVDAAAAELYRRTDAVVFGTSRKRALSRARIAAAEQQIIATLKAHHAAEPQSQGMPLSDLQKSLSAVLSRAAQQYLLKDLTETGRIKSVGAFVRLASHKPAVDNMVVQRWQALLSEAEKFDGKPFTIADLAAALGHSEAAVTDLVVRMRGNGDVWRIADTRFLLREQVYTLAARANALSDEVGKDGFTAAQFRDVAGIGRGLAIQVLEFYDRVGITVRRGDHRTVRKEYQRTLERAAQLERGLPASAYLPKPSKPRRRF